MGVECIDVGVECSTEAQHQNSLIMKRFLFEVNSSHNSSYKRQLQETTAAITAATRDNSSHSSSSHHNSSHHNSSHHNSNTISQTSSHCY